MRTGIPSFLVVAGVAVALAGCSAPPAQQASAPAAAPGAIDRTVLPIPEPKRQTYTELDARNAKAPARWEVKAPAGAPNVVVILIDDIGFGASGAFGGPINMPTLDKVAQTGLKYNRFHTTALCSPTRVALLTGYNHHSNNAGSIMETGTAFPGTPASGRNRLRRSPKCSARMATAPRPSVSITRPRPGRSRPPDHTTAGRRVPDSKSSTGLSAARPISTRRCFTTAPPRSSFRKIRIITSRPT